MADEETIVRGDEAGVVKDEGSGAEGTVSKPKNLVERMFDAVEALVTEVKALREEIDKRPVVDNEGLQKTLNDAVVQAHDDGRIVQGDVTDAVVERVKALHLDEAVADLKGLLGHVAVLEVGGMELDDAIRFVRECVAFGAKDVVLKPGDVTEEVPAQSGSDAVSEYWRARLGYTG